MGYSVKYTKIYGGIHYKEFDDVKSKLHHVF